MVSIDNLINIDKLNMVKMHCNVDLLDLQWINCRLRLSPLYPSSSGGSGDVRAIAGIAGESAPSPAPEHTGRRYNRWVDPLWRWVKT